MRFALVLLAAIALSVSSANSASLPDECSGPMQVGLCDALLERFYFDPVKKSCEQFYYGGCGGNRNNFERLEDCQQKCIAS
ncbi:PI-stichotoxin-She2a-like [Hermetia illucens]|uniref:PI-stichotoxin-She2a-like n=1 Tax=Hermetia illucens TaxID=343691 RepID=UPI0018CBF3B7|nr:PI-stichotoxin-She2a-like [Hermetia illucens]